jgi:hypothetical protein
MVGSRREIFTPLWNDCPCGAFIRSICELE